MQQQQNDHPDTIPKKQCRKCKQLFPATTEYFYKHNRSANTLRTICKSCYDIQRKAYSPPTVVYPQGYISGRALAIRLGLHETKVKDDIRSGRISAMNIGTEKKNYWAISPEDAEVYTRSLSSSQSESTPQLNGHKEETRKRGRPKKIQEEVVDLSHTCRACGVKVRNVVGDVNRDTGEKYGVLCMKCYPLIRDFGEDPTRLRACFDYLVQTRLHHV